MRTRPAKLPLIVAILLTAGLLAAQSPPPPLLHLQGRLTDASGSPLNGPQVLEVRIYDVVSAGTPLWSEQHVTTALNGVVNILLGSVTPIPATLFDQGTRYLALKVGTDPEMTPRRQVASVPFSRKAARVAELDAGTSVPDGFVVSAHLANGSVTALKIAAGAVGSGALASGAVGASALADGSVTSAKIAANAVGTTAINSSAVTLAKLASNSVDASKIVDGSVGAAELATGAVTAAKLAAGAVGTAALADGSVTAPKIAPGAVGPGALGPASVGTAAIADGAVTLVKLAADSVDASKIADGAVGTADLANASVTGPKLAGSAVGTTNLANAAVTPAKLASPLTGSGIFFPVLWVEATPGTAVSGISSGGLGVRGEDSSTTAGGTGKGVYGVTRNPDGTGVYGENLHASTTSLTGKGVHGVSRSTYGVGVYGENTASNASSGAGVQGVSSGSLGRGVFGLSHGGGAGVEGRSTSIQSFSYGVLGISNGLDGSAGVRGEMNGSGQLLAGVWGVTTSSSSGFGVIGEGGRYGIHGISRVTDGIGTSGLAQSATGTNYGVSGQTFSTSGYGVYSQGRFGATGAKSFIQPHPTDPSKEIHFFCQEGNESGTYFRGSARLQGGTAQIQVPEDFRLVTEAEGLTVQLTAVGGPATLWVRSCDLDLVVVAGDRDVGFNYLVQGVRRGFSGLSTVQENRAFVPERRGVPFGTQYPAALRQILVENGILNPDFTPNEEAARVLGWNLDRPSTDLLPAPPAQGGAAGGSGR